MRNKRFLIVLVGALIFGVLAAVSVSRYLSRAQAYTNNLNKVAVAKVAIPLGSKIIPEQIMVVQFPKESTPDGAFDSPEKLAGRVAVMNIAAREPITESRLAPEGTAAGLSAVIPEGYRAMTVNFRFHHPRHSRGRSRCDRSARRFRSAGSDLEDRTAEHQGFGQRSEHRQAEG
jgi:pilus assembly protein CpaB